MRCDTVSYAHVTSKIREKNSCIIKKHIIYLWPISHFALNMRPITVLDK